MVPDTVSTDCSTPLIDEVLSESSCASNLDGGRFPEIPRLDLRRAEKFRDVGEEGWLDGLYWLWEDVKWQWQKIRDWGRLSRSI